MQEASKYAVGIDIGTTTVRAVVGRLNPTTGVPTIVGVGEAPSSGVRKGVIVDLAGPAQAIDEALGEAERMSGHEVHGATLSINGSHILTTHTDGMIAVGAPDHEIGPEDLRRIEEVATLGKVPPNREILDVIPHAYRLDGQENIKDPLGMTGTRLEIDAHVVSALLPHLQNIHRVAESTKVAPHSIVASGVAAARAVLSEAHKEHGVAVIDLGGATTSVAIYEEGDLQYTGVVPLGGVNITNDLAIGLKTDPSIAEQVKREHASAIPRVDRSGVNIKDGDEVHTFYTDEIDEIVGARLDEIFEAVQRELKKAGRAGKLPNGVILTGGGAQFKHIASYAKHQLGLAARVGKPVGFGGVSEDAENPAYVTAVGLMLLDGESAPAPAKPSKFKASKGVAARLFARLKA